MYSETLSNFTYTDADILFYRDFIKTTSKLFDISLDGFLNKTELVDIWYAERRHHADIYGREQTISSINSKKIKSMLIEKFRQHLILDQDHRIVINICKLAQPSYPHIDGHAPFLDKKKYCIAKIFIIPLAFDTEHYDTLSLNTHFVKFKQHYNYHTNGGYEFSRLIEDNLTYNSYNLEDEELNILDKHDEKFVYDGKPSIFHHFQRSIKLQKLQAGLDIQKVSKMKLGSIESLNPYQIHCSGDFKNFNCKWVCRIVLYLKVNP